MRVGLGSADVVGRCLQAEGGCGVLPLEIDFVRAQRRAGSQEAVVVQFQGGPGEPFGRAHVPLRRHGVLDVLLSDFRREWGFGARSFFRRPRRGGPLLDCRADYGGNVHVLALGGHRAAAYLLLVDSILGK